MSAAAITQVEAALQALSPESLTIDDESDLHVGHQEAKRGAHLNIHIIAPCFANLSPLQRHRLVYDTLGNLEAIGVHALSITAEPTAAARA